MKPDDRTVLLGCKSKPSLVLRKMDEAWMEKFLDGKARLNRTTQTLGNESETDMKNKNKKGGASKTPRVPKVKGSIKGVTEYMRAQYVTGMHKDKGEVEKFWERVTKKFPAMASDRKGFDSRIVTCQKIKDREVLNAKAGEKKPATKKAAKKAPVKVAQKAKSKAPKSAKPTPPPAPPIAPPAPPVEAPAEE